MPEATDQLTDSTRGDQLTLPSAKTLAGQSISAVQVVPIRRKPTPS